MGGRNDFDKLGFEVAEVFENREITDFVGSTRQLLEMQLGKMGLSPTGNLQDDSVTLDSTNRGAMDELLLMARHTQAGHALASNGAMMLKASELLSAPAGRLIVSGPSFFLNIPDNNTRKYSWHSEQNWYPKRRRFLNVWCPIISDRTDSNSMAVKVGSHKKDWFYFSEYTGYGAEGGADANVQYEVPSSFLSEFSEEVPAVKVTEALFFDGRLVHRSLDNLSEKPLFTLVFRVFDYIDDLTLSSNWAEVPYSRSSKGWPEINVRP